MKQRIKRVYLSKNVTTSEKALNSNSDDDRTKAMKSICSFNIVVNHRFVYTNVDLCWLYTATVSSKILHL